MHYVHGVTSARFAPEVTWLRHARAKLRFVTRAILKIVNPYV